MIPMLDLADLAKLALDIGGDIVLERLFDPNKTEKQERTPKEKKDVSSTPSGEPWEQNHPTPPWEKE